jgi:hypothetical protein
MGLNAGKIFIQVVYDMLVINYSAIDQIPIAFGHETLAVGVPYFLDISGGALAFWFYT